MIGLAVVAALLGGAPLEVHSATRDVRDCQAVAGDRVDAPGYLAATDGGLALVTADGRELDLLTRFDGLPETRAHVIEPVAGARAAWWVGTEGGLARVERRGDALVVTDSWASPPVRAVLEHGGHTWVGTWGAGVAELRGDRLVAVAGPTGADDSIDAKAERITALAVHDDRVVVASAGAGAWYLNRAVPIVGLDPMIWSLAVVDDVLHAGTLVGVQAVRGDRVITLDSADARALAPLAGGGLRIASRGQGVIDRHVGVTTLAVPGLSHAQGLDGDRCVASPDGLWIQDGRGGWQAALTEGLPGGDVTAVLAVDAAVWVATFEHGLAVRRDGRWQSVPDPDGVIDPHVNALADAGGGRVWVATTRGLHRVGPAGIESWTAKHGLPNSHVLSLAPLRSGELLVGTHAGVALLDADGRIRPLGRKARAWATWAVAEGRDGTLWLGTTQGLIAWRSDGTWQHLSLLSGHLADNWVTALLIEGDTVHVGTYAGGVASLRPAPEGRGWAATQLGGGRVNPGGLAQVDGQLTAATMKGAQVWLRGGWRPLAEALFEDVTAIVDTDEGVWIASRRGLVRHAP